MGRQRTVDAPGRDTSNTMGLDTTQVRLGDLHQQVRRMVPRPDTEERPTDPQRQTPLGRLRLGHRHAYALQRDFHLYHRGPHGGHSQSQRDPPTTYDEEDQIYQGQRFFLQPQRQGIPEVVAPR